jgi:hypothetical protein
MNIMLWVLIFYVGVGLCTSLPFLPHFVVAVTMLATWHDKKQPQITDFSALWIFSLKMLGFILGVFIAITLLWPLHLVTTVPNFFRTRQAARL